jgi:hypothetical protein
MTKAWCIWCELSTGTPSHGYYWIHPKCFDELISVTSNLKEVEKYLKGELPRIAKNGNKIGYDSVENFLVAMANFDRRSSNLRKLIKSFREGMPLETLEQSLSEGKS